MHSNFFPEGLSASRYREDREGDVVDRALRLYVLFANDRSHAVELTANCDYMHAQEEPSRASLRKQWISPALLRRLRERTVKSQALYTSAPGRDLVSVVATVKGF